MPDIDLLCLANSFKRGGGCVAGIRLDTGAWIRPVTDSEDGTLPSSRCQLDVGRPAAPLDVIRMSLARPAPRVHQPEDWIAGPQQWRLRSSHKFPAAADVLDRYTFRGGMLFGTPTDRVPETTIGETGVEASLALLRIEAPVFRSEVNPFDGKTKVRAVFIHGGVAYDLSVTDRNLRVGLAKVIGTYPSFADWYVTISLGEPFRGACYKLIAAALEVPFVDASERLFRIWANAGGRSYPGDAAQRERMTQSRAFQELCHMPDDVLVRSVRTAQPPSFSAWLLAARESAGE